MSMTQKAATPTVAAEVTALFRTKRVSEIRQIESRVRLEAEDKSEALRDLLGTRYKDLLSAADRVLAVRDASKSSVTDALSHLARSSTELREHFLLKSGYKVHSPGPQNDDVNRRRQIQAIGAKLKHIVDSTEMLYACLESGDLYDASLRFSTAHRNYEELKKSGAMEGATNRFAEQQWRLVAAFKPQIVTASELRLVSEGLATTEYAKVFAALMILRGTGANASSILQIFLRARSDFVSKELIASNGAVKERMKRVAALVKDTIACIAEMLHPENGAVLKMVETVDISAAAVIKAECTGSKLHAACAPWIEEVREILESDGKQLLSEVSTSRELANALTDVQAILDDETWTGACNVALGAKAASVFVIFKPVISERANIVASESIARVADTVRSSVDKAWSSVKGSTDTGKEVWNSITAESVHQIDGCGMEGTENVGKVLSLSGPVADVGRTIETALGSALSDAKVVAEHIPSVSATLNAAVYSTIPCIAESVEEKVNALVQKSTIDASNEDRVQYAEQALFAARVCGSFTSSAQIKEAFHFEDSFNVDEQHEKKSNEQYVQFCQRLEQVSSASYQVWAVQVCSKLCQELRIDLDTHLSKEAPTSWTQSGAPKSKVNTGGEQDPLNVVKCVRTASVAAIRCSIGACTAANRAGGLALPRKALLALTAEMRKAICKAYTESICFYKGEVQNGSGDGRSKLGSGTHDTVFMQMLFDLRFFSLILDGVSETGWKSNASSLTSIAATLEGSIDPIDLASSKSMMFESVKEYASRTSVLLGTFSFVANGKGVQPTPYMSSSGLEFANLVSIAPTVPRFAYLPAPMPSTYSIGSSGAAGLSARAAVEQLRHETKASVPGSSKKQDQEASVADYASKVSESVGRLGSRFLNFARTVG